jgi:hypothetical protein
MSLLAILCSFLLAFTLATATTVSDLNVTAIHQNDTIALAKSLASPSVLGTQAQQQNAVCLPAPIFPDRINIVTVGHVPRSKPRPYQPAERKFRRWPLARGKTSPSQLSRHDF